MYLEMGIKKDYLNIIDKKVICIRLGWWFCKVFVNVLELYWKYGVKLNVLFFKNYDFLFKYFFVSEF